MQSKTHLVVRAIHRIDCENLLSHAGCSAKVVAHCRAVTECACEYARHNPDIDHALVWQGAMLHDIGRGATYGIGHAQTGADFLRSMNVAEEIARIVECHTGAGITADECTLLRLFPRDCIPQTIEEKIITHADNLIAGTRRVSMYRSIGSAIHLPRKVRRRMYHLALDVRLLCS